jgi:hypothetical protein
MQRTWRPVAPSTVDSSMACTAVRGVGAQGRIVTRQATTTCGCDGTIHGHRRCHYCAAANAEGGIGQRGGKHPRKSRGGLAGGANRIRRRGRRRADGAGKRELAKLLSPRPGTSPLSSPSVESGRPTCEQRQWALRVVTLSILSRRPHAAVHARHEAGSRRR